MLLATAACGGGGSDEATPLRLGYFPNVTHAPAIIGVEDGLFAEAARRDVTLETVDVQRRHRGDRGAVLRRDRRQLHRPQPGDQRLRQVRRRGAAHRRRHDVGRRLAGRPRGHRRPGRPAGKTLATPSLGNTQDVALRAWLPTQGFATDTSGGGDVAITPQENADTLAAFQGGAHRRRLGARAVGDPPDPRGRRPRARRRGRPVARRAVRHHPPDRRDRRSSTTTPTSSSDLIDGLGRRDRRRRRRPRRGAGGGQRRHRGDHDQAASPTRPSPAPGRT